MQVVPTRTLKLEGQKFKFNESSGVVIFEITQPFMTAGRMLGWSSEFGIPGFGINRSIIKFVQQRRIKLLIRVLSAPGNKEYWINHSTLTDFIKHNISEYTVSGKTINVIPWVLFVAKPNFSGAQS